MRKARSSHLVFLSFEELQVHRAVPRGGHQLLPRAGEHHQQLPAENPQLHQPHPGLEPPLLLCK